MPNKFFELNCTSPNNTIPKPVVTMSFIWPAFHDTTAMNVRQIPQQGTGTHSKMNFKASCSVPVIVVAKGEFIVVHLNIQRFNRNA